MIFRDRREAGEILAKDLAAYSNAPNTIVLGLPRGGVVTAYAVAKALHLPLDITAPRKISAPDNPEFAIGAVTESGEAIIDQDVLEGLQVSEEYLKQAIEQETATAKRRLKIFRKGMPERVLEGKTVIIVDDGLATGYTMMAAIKLVKLQKAARIVVAVPVSPLDTKIKLDPLVDDMICLSTPSHFYAVGQFYQNFDQVEDDQVLKILEMVKE